MEAVIVALGALVVVIALVCVIGLIVSYPAMLLWNGCLVGLIDGVHEITWLQMWGIVVLFGILFKTSVSTKKD